MVPAGYMAKRVCKRPDWLKADRVIDIYSISGCMSEHFADYVEYWKHNGFWLFDSPSVIKALAGEKAIDLAESSLFYYEVHESEFDGETWHSFGPDSSMTTKVEIPASKRLEGFDVATFSCRNLPECSPLSCNGLAQEVMTNSHCLFASFEEAETSLKNGIFKNSEPGPYRIFSVNSVQWDM